MDFQKTIEIFHQIAVGALKVVGLLSGLTWLASPILQPVLAVIPGLGPLLPYLTVLGYVAHQWDDAMQGRQDKTTAVQQILLELEQRGIIPTKPAAPAAPPAPGAPK